MPIPPDNRAIGDGGHVTDHNAIADELTALASALTAETSRATAAEALALAQASNLSDVASAATARTNLGLGTAAVVNTPIAASNLAVDGTGIGGPTVTGLGLALMSINPIYANANSNLTNEQVNIVLVTATISATITKLGFLCSVAGVTAGAGVNQMGLYTEAGTLVALTGDMTTVMQSTGFAEGTIANPGGITSCNITKGTNYYLAVVASFTGTVPKAQGFSTGLSVAGSAGALNGHYLSRYLSTQSTMPSSITPSSMTAQPSALFAYAR